MRKRPEIPEDVFFDTVPANDDPQPDLPAEADPETVDAPPDDDVLRKSMDDVDAPAKTRITLSEARARQAERKARRPQGAGESDASRVGRPPAQEGPKVAVTLYLTEPVAHLLEEVKFLLLTEYDVRTSKSAIADFALRSGLDDLQAAADDLRRH
ncbi:MAG: hypothetical protein ACOX9R_06860 [Armatimonadota bacterium]